MQPWQPMPRRYSYQRNPAGHVWFDFERAADAAHYQVFTAEHPSAQYRALQAREGQSVPTPQDSTNTHTGDRQDSIPRQTRSPSLICLPQTSRNNRPNRLSVYAQKHLPTYRLKICPGCLMHSSAAQAMRCERRCLQPYFRQRARAVLWQARLHVIRPGG